VKNITNTSTVNIIIVLYGVSYLFDGISSIRLSEERLRTWQKHTDIDVERVSLYLEKWETECRGVGFDSGGGKKYSSRRRRRRV
jgi:hypothetical protein